MLLVRRIMGESMLPKFQPNTIVIAWLYKKPRVGDVVIAVQNGREIIKRVTRQRGDAYFIEGDNPGQSTDSRTFGWLTLQAIRAVVIGVLWRV